MEGKSGYLTSTGIFRNCLITAPSFFDSCCPKKELMESLSVIICTYNPNESIFQKCLECVEVASRQIVPTEVIIVDNNSSTPLRNSKIVAEFSNRQANVRLVEEKTAGLTPARLRGIQEAHGELLVFIDDDNFIAPDFFAKGMEVAKYNTHIGSWSGQVKLVFEIQPPDW